MSANRATLAGATIGVIVAAAESLRPSLTPRSTLHQGLVTGTMATTGAAVGAFGGAVVGRLFGRPTQSFWVPAISVTAAAGVGAVRAHRHANAQVTAHEEWGPHEGEPVTGAIVGSAAAAGLATAAALTTREIRSGGTAVAERVGGPPQLWSVTAATVAAGGITTAGRVAFNRVLAGLSDAGFAPDAALAEPIDDPFVSGGPGSSVEYDTLSREGRRFVHWRVKQADLIAAGVPDPQEPVRVFIGVDSAGSITSRVDLAMRELERLGAFTKSAILVESPAGSGYANSVPAEALEFFTRGDCASVVIQYGVLPSMFSTKKVPVAAQTFRSLVDRIHERTQGLSPRPQLFAYGESLGAGAAEVGLMLDPPLVDLTTAAMDKVDAALFVGTPGGSSLRDDLLDNPGTVHVDQWQALPDPLPTGIQLWFLEHDADPVTRFSRRLLLRKPRWLGQPPRGRNIPDDMRWAPIGTWQQVLFDVAYATQAQSGVFRSVGHDYRADLAPLVAAAFVPSAWDQVHMVQNLLADREVTRDRMLAAAEGEAATGAPSASGEPTG